MLRSWEPQGLDQSNVRGLEGIILSLEITGALAVSVSSTCFVFKE